MPTISRFYGIEIMINYRGEHPPAHFHAIYGSARASIGISPLGVLDGSLPPRILGMVFEWAALHQTELMEDWNHAIQMKPLKQIEPLP